VRRGFHLHVDLCPVRIADRDGRTLPAGEAGDVILSNLINRATVLINYRVGDIATMGTQRCACGRSLPVLESLVGRRDEWFDLPDGRAVHTQELRALFRGEVAVWRYQLVQEADRRVRAALVVDDQCDREATRRHIEIKLRTSLGPDVPLEVTVVPSIEPGPNGKHRPILSHRRRADGWASGAQRGSELGVG
jgi:phenylacetate-CoA ligase